MTVWTVLFLVACGSAGLLGVWALIKRRRLVLGITGILWLATAIFRLFVPSVWHWGPFKGGPVVGQLLLFLILPLGVALALADR